MPLPGKMFFDGSSFSTPRSWVPIVNTEPFLFGQSVGHVVVEVILLVDVECFLAGASRNAALEPFTSTT